jgi:uncharacterized protein
MSRIFWDTNLFIYLFEDYGHHSQQVSALLKKMEERGDELLTSVLTIGEITAQPLIQGDSDRCSGYENTIQSSAIVFPFDLAAARNFAKLRARHQKNIRPPDAIQLACAATAGVDLFLTNDTRLHNIRIDGIHFITSVDRAPI